MKTAKGLTVAIAPITYKYLCRLGIPAHLDGYRYMAQILQEHVEEIPDCKIVPLYADIGREVGTTGSRVERALRHMVESSWLNIEEGPLKRQLVNSTSLNHKGAPTNSDYLVAVAYDFMNYLVENKGA